MNATTYAVDTAKNVMQLHWVDGDTGEIHRRAFVRGNKDDAADARAIWVAAGHGDIRRVPIKSVEQPAVLALHRTRKHWVSVRTSTINSLRGLLYEFGVFLP